MRLEKLSVLNQQIESKITKMKVYDDFLNMVIEQNSDEYEGPENVVFRYKTLKESNKRLKHS